jgi:tetratricopeptide (TPR) repeat protein
MTNYRNISAPTLFRTACILLLALELAGCAGSGRSDKPDAPAAAGTRTLPQRPEPTAEDRQDIALQHFLAGSTFDQKGEYANAIIEYQDALRYKEDPAIHHAIAKDYSLLEKPELALESARKAVELDSTNRQYRETLAQIYVNTVDVENATRQFAAIVRQDPMYKPALLNLARLIQLQSSDSALVLYQRVVDRFGPDMAAYSQMAQIYSAQGKQALAADILKKMLEIDPGSYEIKKGLGDTYLREDSVDAALKVYDELVILRPDDLELRASRTHAYLTKQDYENAAAQFDHVMTQDSITIDDQIRFGQIFVSFVEKDSAVAPHAIKMFQKIRERNPEDWRPYWFLGALDNIVKDDSSALKHFTKVTELAPWNVDGWVGVASIFYDHDEFDKAIEVLIRAKAKLPDELRVHLLLGVTYQRSQHPQEAKTALERAVNINPKSVDALSALGMVYNELGQMAESDTMYERALRVEPKNHLVLNNYGYSLAERNMQIERARTMSKEAIRQQPDNQSYLDTYGWILYQMGKYAEAEQQIRKAVELGSTSAVIHEHLGDVYYKLGQAEKAMTYWRKALEINPGNTALKDKIERGKL